MENIWRRVAGWGDECAHSALSEVTFVKAATVAAAEIELLCVCVVLQEQ